MGRWTIPFPSRDPFETPVYLYNLLWVRDGGSSSRDGYPICVGDAKIRQLSVIERKTLIFVLELKIIKMVDINVEICRQIKTDKNS